MTNNRTIWAWYFVTKADLKIMFGTGQNTWYRKSTKILFIKWTSWPFNLQLLEQFCTLIFFFYFNAFYSKKAHRNLPSRCSISLTLTLLKKNVLYSKHESQLSEVLAGKSKLTNQVKLKFCARQLFHLEHSDSFRNIKQPHPSSQYKKHNGFCKF